MSWYLIELADDALTPYAIETGGGTVYGWGETPKRKVDVRELLAVADELDEELSWSVGYDDPSPDDVNRWNHELAGRIRKAVGL